MVESPTIRNHPTFYGRRSWRRWRWRHNHPFESKFPTPSILLLLLYHS
jgi:hypothetical protein